MKATAAAVIAVGVATAAATAASYDPGFLAAPSIKQVAAATTDPWDRVREQLDTFRDSKYFNFSKFAFSAGDVTGRKFEYTDAHVTLEQRLLLASASKFPSACAIAGAVADGHLAFDTKASEVFDWWSSDPADIRANVTLRQLLSFTSGLYWKDASSGGVACMAGDGGIIFTPEECAQQIYEHAPWEFEPGTTFAYNSFHLQVAGAMAAKAANTTVRQLIDNLFEKAGMNSSGYLPGQNPLMAAAMYTVGRDYDQLLSKYVAYDLLPKEVCDELERDYLSAPYATKVANSSSDLTSFFGHYSMGNWFECMYGITPGAEKGKNWAPACGADNLHMDEGLFGYFPMVDRAQGIYLQIPQMVIVGLDDPNPACAGAIELRAFIKPWVDWAINNGTGPPPKSALDVTAHARGRDNMEKMRGIDSSMGLPQGTWDSLVEQFHALP